MKLNIENFNHQKSRRIETLEQRIEELRNQLRSEPAFITQPLRDYDTGAPGGHGTSIPPSDGGFVPPPDERTERLLNHGRRDVYRRGLSRNYKIAIAAAAAGAIIAILVLTVFSGSPSWPSSVATVQAEITKACQNPDVAAEPGQVNFACSKATSQILWVFSLMTSDDNPGFADARTGRRGLEPITPAQGGEVAWSLNLHQPYDPMDAVDSLEVAARAINNIIGGATVTGSNGSQQVEPGLESNPSNCARYTGSAAIVTRAGYPSVCALPVTSAAGQAALVSDVYSEWVLGASQVIAQDAGVLFENSNDPGNSQVQEILKNLPASGV
jgi:hypothetical protein